MGSILVEDLLAGRRSALKALVGGGAAMIAAPALGKRNGKAAPRPLNYADPADNLYAFGKIWSGFEVPVIGAYHGLMYARIPGKRLMPLFHYVGTGVVQCRFEADGKLALKSRETGYFTDLHTGEVLEYWDNPLTGQRVEVYHFYNDVIGGRIGNEIPKFAMSTDPDAHTLMNEGTVFPGPDGRTPFRLPFEFYGDDVMLGWDYAHRYKNPVTPEGWPSYSSGPVVTPSEHFLFKVDRRELEDRNIPTSRMYAGFSRLSEPWPWMKMGGTEFAATTVFGRMHSHKGLKGYGDIPPKVLAYVEKHAPEYLSITPDWPVANARLDTWSCFATDVPPETPGYEWKRNADAAKVKPPTGLGARTA